MPPRWQTHPNDVSKSPQGNFSSQRQPAVGPSGKPFLSHSTETELELTEVRPVAWQPEAQPEPHCTETLSVQSMLPFG